MRQKEKTAIENRFVRALIHDMKARPVHNVGRNAISTNHGSDRICDLCLSWIISAEFGDVGHLKLLFGIFSFSESVFPFPVVHAFLLYGREFLKDFPSIVL